MISVMTQLLLKKAVVSVFKKLKLKMHKYFNNHFCITKLSRIRIQHMKNSAQDSSKYLQWADLDWTTSVHQSHSISPFFSQTGKRNYNEMFVDGVKNRERSPPITMMGKTDLTFEICLNDEICLIYQQSIQSRMMKNKTYILKHLPPITPFFLGFLQLHSQFVYLVCPSGTGGWKRGQQSVHHTFFLRGGLLTFFPCSSVESLT